MLAALPVALLPLLAPLDGAGVVPGELPAVEEPVVVAGVDVRVEPEPPAEVK